MRRYLAGLGGHDGDGGGEAGVARPPLHRGERGLDEVEGAHEVDVHRELHLLELLLLQLLRHEHAVVAHQHVDGARRLHGPGHGVGVPDVGGEGRDVAPSGAADLVAGLLEARGVAGEDGDAGALGGGGAGEGEADAAGAARDEHVAALEGDPDGPGADEEGEGEKEDNGRDGEGEEDEARRHGRGEGRDLGLGRCGGGKVREGEAETAVGEWRGASAFKRGRSDGVGAEPDWFESARWTTTLEPGREARGN